MSDKSTILVVDDEETIREVVCRYLEREGYVARQAAEGYEALDIIRHDPPALIVLDLIAEVCCTEMYIALGTVVIADPALPAVERAESLV